MRKSEQFPKQNEYTQEQTSRKETKEDEPDVAAKIKEGEKGFLKKFYKAPRLVRNVIYGLSVLTFFATAEAAFAGQKETAKQPSRPEQIISEEEQKSIEQLHQEYFQEIRGDFDAAIDSAEVGNKELFMQYIFGPSMEAPSGGIGEYLFDQQQKLLRDYYTPTKVKLLPDGEQIQLWVDDQGHIQKELRFSPKPARMGNDIIQADKAVKIIEERHSKEELTSKITKDIKKLENKVGDLRTFLTVYKQADNEIEKGYARQQIIKLVDKIKADYGSEIFQDDFWQEIVDIIK